MSFYHRLAAKWSLWISGALLCAFGIYRVFSVRPDYGLEITVPMAVWGIGAVFLGFLLILIGNTFRA